VKSDPFSRRLARAGLALAGLGFATYLLGVRADLLGLDRTAGIGVVQITVLLGGIALMTAGAFVYAYLTLRRGRPIRLPAQVGGRLMATGLVVAIAAGYADYLGIGRNYDHPYFGPLKALGVAIGVVTIAVGIFLYSL